MENNEILMEEDDSILTLTDENGVDTQFEYMDCIEYQGTEYLVLMPLEGEDAEIVILAIEPVDEENENYLAVEDEVVLEAVYGIFKERYKDVLNFADYHLKTAVATATAVFYGQYALFLWGKFEDFTKKSPECHFPLV